MSLTSLAICGERFKIRADHRGHTATFRMPRDLGRGGLSLPERLLQSLQCDRLADRPTMPETVGNRPRDTEYFHGNILDLHGDDIVREKRVCEPHHPHRRSSLLRHPVLCADRHPGCAWKLIGQFVVGKCRDETDDALGNTFCGFGQAVICVKWHVGQLVEPARKADGVTSVDHAADRGCGDSSLLELGQAHDPLPLQEFGRLIELRLYLRDLYQNIELCT